MERGSKPYYQAEQSSGQEAALRGVIDQAVQNLLGELQQGKSDRLLDYLAFSARFHRYSLGNQLLIYSQCPQASHVAGYKTWQALGHQVKKGAKGIRILAPRPYMKADEETSEEKQAVRFVSVAVFDASQLTDTDERPLPQFFSRLQDDQEDLCSRLEDAMRADEIELYKSGHLGATQGYSAHGKVVTKEGLDSRSRLFVLTHEYAHELLHWNGETQNVSKNVQECHAEAVSYIVAAHFGLHNPRSSDYLLHWGTTAAELLEELNVVRRTAAYIIDEVNPG